MRSTTYLPVIAGFGFRKAADYSSFSQLFERLECPSGEYIAAVAADKADHSAFRQFCADYGLKIHPVPQHQLSSVTTPTRSEISMSYRNVGSLCEALALYCAGSNAQLWITRQISDDRLVSCAVAQTAGYKAQEERL